MTIKKIGKDLPPSDIDIRVAANDERAENIAIKVKENPGEWFECGYTFPNAIGAYYDFLDIQAALDSFDVETQRIVINGEIHFYARWNGSRKSLFRRVLDGILGK